MKSLARRTSEYYFRQGLKIFGMVMIVQVLLTLEFIFLESENQDLMSFITQNLVTFTGFFMIIFNTIYAMYGPSWFDSVVLSMGARRKDVFLGQIIQQLTLIILCTAVEIAGCFLFDHMEFIGYTGLSAATALLFGVIGTVVGYKIKKFGKIVMIIIVMAMTVMGFAMGMLKALGGQIPFSSLNSALAISIIAVVAILGFILLELWAYKLNSKCMVS